MSLEELLGSLIGFSACPQDQTPTDGWNCSEKNKYMEEKMIIPARF